MIYVKKYIPNTNIYTLFQNGDRKHENEVEGARIRDFVINCIRSREFFKFCLFFGEKNISFEYGQFEASEEDIYGKIHAVRRPAGLLLRYLCL